MVTLKSNGRLVIASASDVLESTLADSWRMLRDLANHPARFQSFISRPLPAQAPMKQLLRRPPNLYHRTPSGPRLRHCLRAPRRDPDAGELGPPTRRMRQDGKQHIYLNADWLANADSGVAAKVLIEEIPRHRPTFERESR